MKKSKCCGAKLREDSFVDYICSECHHPCDTIEQETDDFFPKSMVDKHLAEQNEEEGKEHFNMACGLTDLEKGKTPTPNDWIENKMKDIKKPIIVYFRLILDSSLPDIKKFKGTMKKFEKLLDNGFEQSLTQQKEMIEKEWREKIDIVISTHLTGKPWQEEDVLLKMVKEELLNKN